MSDQQKALWIVLLYSLLSGAMGAVTKIGLFDFPPLTFAFLRFLVAGLLVLPFVLKKQKSIIADIKTLWLVSLFALINNILFVVGVQMTTATISQIIYALVPLMVFGILSIFLNHKYSQKKIVGIVVGFIGVVIIVLLPFIEVGGAFSGTIQGNVLISIAALCWSIYMVKSKDLLKKYSPFYMTSIFIIISTVLLFPFFLIDVYINFGWWENLRIESFSSLIYVIFIGTLLAYTLNQYAIKHGGSLLASMSFYLSPLFGYLAAFLLLSEMLTPGIIVGGILALIGVFLVST